MGRVERFLEGNGSGAREHERIGPSGDHVVALEEASENLYMSRVARACQDGDLHEGIGQALSVIKLNTESTLDTLRKNPGNFDSKNLEAIISMAEKANENVRRIVKDLRPSTLDVLGILPTISLVIEEFEMKNTDIRIEKNINVEEDEIEVSLKTIIYSTM